MNQKIVLISGIVLLSLIVVLSFVITVETAPTGDLVVRSPGRFLGWKLPTYPEGFKMPECEESDEGRDYYKKGALAAKDSGVKYDSCAEGGKYVSEYYCRDTGKIGVILHRCKYGCDNGACKTAGLDLITPPSGPGLAN